MKLVLDGQTFEIDRAGLEQKLIESVGGKLDEWKDNLPTAEKFQMGIMESGIKSAIAVAFNMLGKKNPEFRKPNDEDTIQFAIKVIVTMLLNTWEKEGIVFNTKPGDVAQNVTQH